MASRNLRQPNIVFILTDDQGAWAMGCAGNREIHTPNLDRIAATGRRFDHFFCASPVCSPARASILTGRIPSQHGIHDWLRCGNLIDTEENGQPYDRSAIEYLHGLRGYTDVLAEHGYTCGLSGKWHLGDSIRPQKGFSYWHVYPWGGGDYNGAQIIRDGRLETDPRYLTDVITEGAVNFLENQSRTTTPFYLSVHYTAPHSPWDRGQHPLELTALYTGCSFETCPDGPAHPWQINSAPRRTGERRIELLTGYYAAISGLDRGVGRILDWLESHGLRDNTLVIFSSDNGMNMGHHGIWGKGNGTFPLNMYDSSVKVPMLLSHPGHIDACAVDHHLLSHYDIMPTLVDYIGIPNREDQSLPGRSFMALLRNETFQQRDHVIVCDEYGPVRMIRTHEWKYVHRYPYGPHELYHLSIDPDEGINLVNEPGYAAQKEELRGMLIDWFSRYVDPSRDGSKEPVNGKGQVDLSGWQGKGRTAFEEDWWYIDANGRRREDRGAELQMRYFTGAE